jgi:hypothetical protein
MKTPRLFLAAVGLILASGVLFAQTKMVMNFDGTAGAWNVSLQAVGAAANNVFTVSDFPDEFVEGTGSLLVDARLRGMGASWGTWTDAQYTFATPLDLSGTDDIRFNMKIITPPSYVGATIAGTRALQFVVDLYDSVYYQGAGNVVLWRYCAGTGDMNIFYYPHKTWIDPVNTGWFEVVIPMSALRYPGWYTPKADSVIHKDHIVRIGFGVDGDSTGTDSVKFLIDNMRATKRVDVVQAQSMDGPASAWSIGIGAPANSATASDFFDDYVEGAGSMLVDVALRQMQASWGTWTDFGYRFPTPINATGATELRFWYKTLVKPNNGKDLQFVIDLFDSSAAGAEGPWRWAPGYGQLGLWAPGLENVAQNTWTEVAVPLRDLSVPDWATHADSVLNVDYITAMAFGVEGDSSGTDSVQFLIDNVFFTKAGVSGDVRPIPSTGVPSEFRLDQNYPNPFNPSTTIDYTLGQSGRVTLKIYNVVGQLVETVLNNVDQAKGTYRATVDIRNRASGMYVYVLEQGTRRLTKTMMLLK